MLMLCSFISIPVIAADFWVEPQVVHANGKNGSQVNGGVSGSLGGSVGYYVFGQTLSDGYRLLYGGPTWKPLSWLEVGVGIGRENTPDSMRRNAYFQADIEKFSAYGTFENGGSGPWHQVVLKYRINDSIGIGIMDQSFLGLGPQVEYSIKKGVKVWGAVLRDHDTGKTNSTLAVNFSF